MSYIWTKWTTVSVFTQNNAHDWSRKQCVDIRSFVGSELSPDSAELTKSFSVL